MPYGAGCPPIRHAGTLFCVVPQILDKVLRAGVEFLQEQRRTTHEASGKAMTTRSYKATITSSNRPGWSVTFSHPLRTDARGKLGLKMRRGLGTADKDEAQRLVDQLNELLADQTWWSLDRLGDAGRQFDSRIVTAFFNRISIGKLDSRQLRQEVMPLPTPEQGYARVMMVGSTGAGKTTLLRQLIGSDHKRDRFPSTSTAKTTTAEIEIVADTTAEYYDAVITFKTEHEIRCAVDECLEAACIAVIREPRRCGGRQRIA